MTFEHESQGRIQADAWKPGLPRDFFKYGISPGLSEKKNYEKQVILTEKRCWASTLQGLPKYSKVAQSGVKRRKVAQRGAKWRKVA